MLPPMVLVMIEGALWCSPRLHTSGLLASPPGRSRILFYFEFQQGVLSANMLLKNNATDEHVYVHLCTQYKHIICEKEEYTSRTEAAASACRRTRWRLQASRPLRLAASSPSRTAQRDPPKAGPKLLLSLSPWSGILGGILIYGLSKEQDAISDQIPEAPCSQLLGRGIPLGLCKKPM